MPSDGDNLSEYSSGFFDQDEDENTLKVGRQGKLKDSVRGSKVSSVNQRYPTTLPLTVHFMFCQWQPETSVRIVEPAPPSLPFAIT